VGCGQDASKDDLNQIKGQVQDLQKQVQDLYLAQSNTAVYLSQAIRMMSIKPGGGVNGEALRSTREALQTNSMTISEISNEVVTLNQLTAMAAQERETQTQMAETVQSNLEVINLRLDAIEQWAENSQ
jgi:hypothetical protein